MLNAGSPTEIEAAFATVSAQRIGAVFMGNSQKASLKCCAAGG
jgi:hypothetical protein